MDEELKAAVELLWILRQEKKGIIAERNYLYRSVDWKRCNELFYGKSEYTKEMIDERNKILNSWDRKRTWELDREQTDIDTQEYEIEKKYSLYARSIGYLEK